MARRSPRFEIVRTDAGFHARFIAGNGRTVWWTENYTRRGKAEAAVNMLAEGDVVLRTLIARYVDERTARGHAHP